MSDKDKPQAPSKGRIVFLKTPAQPDGVSANRERAAIVAKVNEDGTINVAIINENGTTGEFAKNVPASWNVKSSEVETTECWDWPARV